jgi:hypothetical protein
MITSHVYRANKELVYGRAREWNKDKYLGGADHFVPVGDAHKQLAGGGYGHRSRCVMCVCVLCVCACRCGCVCRQVQVCMQAVARQLQLGRC